MVTLTLALSLREREKLSTLTPALSLRERGKLSTLTPTLSLRERGKGKSALDLFPLPQGEG